MHKLVSKGILALGALLTLSLAGTTSRADNFLIVPVGPQNYPTSRTRNREQCSGGFRAPVPQPMRSVLSLTAPMIRAQTGVATW